MSLKSLKIEEPPECSKGSQVMTFRPLSQTWSRGVHSSSLQADKLSQDPITCLSCIMKDTEIHGGETSAFRLSVRAQADRPLEVVLGGGVLGLWKDRR